jgi:hypothetical protein
MRNALHEELVEIRREDRQKLGAFEERRTRALRFRQHPAIEIEPSPPRSIHTSARGAFSAEGAASRSSVGTARVSVMALHQDI